MKTWLNCGEELKEMDSENQEENQEKNQKELKEQSLKIKQFAFLLSSGGLLLGSIILGYFIGRQFGEKGSIIGILLGTLVGVLTLINDLYKILKTDKKKEK